MTNSQQHPAVLGAATVLMDKLGSLPKDGEMMQNGRVRYSYRSSEALINALAPLFRECALMLQSKVLDCQTSAYVSTNRDGHQVQWNRTHVTARFTITSLEDGSELHLESIGEGLDNSDKSAAKAMTYALKTALGQGLMLSTEEDPDADRPQVSGSTQSPVLSPEDVEKRQQTAAQALEKLRAPGITAEQVASMKAWLARNGLLEIAVDGMPVSQHVQVIEQTFPGAPTPEHTAHDPQAPMPGESQ